MFELLISSIQSKDPANVEKFLADKDVNSVLPTVNDKAHAYQRLFRELHIISNPQISNIILAKTNLLDIPDDTLTETINASNVTVINALLDEIAKQLDNVDICSKAHKFCNEIFNSSHKNVLDCFFSHPLLLKWPTLLTILAKLIQKSHDHLIEYLKSRFKYNTSQKETIHIWAHIFIYAISNGNTGLINSLLTIEPPLKLFEDEGYHFLFNVIKNGRLSDKDKMEIAKQLIALGANTNAVKADTGEHVVHACAGEDNVELLKLVIAHGADISACDKQGRDICYYAFTHQLGTDVMPFPFRVPHHLNSALISYLQQRGHKAATTRNGTLLHHIINSEHPMGTLYNIPGIDAVNLSKEIVTQMLPFIEMNPPSESPLSDDDHALHSMPKAKRIHSHLAAFFAQGIFDHTIIRCLLEAGEDPNAIDQHERNNVLQIRHPIHYLTKYFEALPACTRFNLLHVVGLMVDYGLIENEWFKFSLATFTKGIPGDSSAQEVRHLVETYINVLRAQIKNDYELAYKLLSQIHKSAHTYSFITNCAGQFAHRFAIVCQHLNKFEEAFEWLEKAKQSTQQISVTNDLVSLCSEWYEALSKNTINPNFGPWLKLFNIMDSLSHKELTATSHYILGHLYSIVKGFDPIRRQECMRSHLNKVTYGPHRQAAKRLLELQTTPLESSSSKLIP